MQGGPAPWEGTSDRRRAATSAAGRRAAVREPGILAATQATLAAGHRSRASERPILTRDALPFVLPSRGPHALAQVRNPLVGGLPRAPADARSARFPAERDLADPPAEAAGGGGPTPPGRSCRPSRVCARAPPHHPRHGRAKPDARSGPQSTPRRPGGPRCSAGRSTARTPRRRAPIRAGETHRTGPSASESRATMRP